jgi:Skp family chaperone for outer membrane proteins
LFQIFDIKDGEYYIMSDTDIKKMKTEHLKSICCATIAFSVLSAFLILVMQFMHIEGIILIAVSGITVSAGMLIRYLHKNNKLTLSHILVIYLVATGTILGGLSYYFAFIELTNTLEQLSKYIMIETVAGSAGYFIKAGFENITKIREQRDKAETEIRAEYKKKLEAMEKEITAEKKEYQNAAASIQDEISKTKLNEEKKKLAEDAAKELLKEKEKLQKAFDKEKETLLKALEKEREAFKKATK